jgi:hypothetical protein
LVEVLEVFNRQGYTAVGGKLDGVAAEIDEDLFQAYWIGGDMCG